MPPQLPRLNYEMMKAEPVPVRVVHYLPSNALATSKEEFS